MGDRLKVVTVLGTRPEIIRLSRVMALLDEHVDHKLVHTGQNSDHELNEVFFQDLKVRPPDYFLGISRSSLGRLLGEILIRCEEVFIAEKPDAVLILGDTNSAFAAVLARRMRIPVYHMEAGNRCFDFNVPEELNRRIVDHVSDFNLVYTEHARRNLLAEGVPARRIYLTGSPMKEVLDANRDGIAGSAILNELSLKPQQYFIVSMHRAENVDVAENLTSLLDALSALCECYGLPVIVSTHPRTRDKLEKLGHQGVHPLIQFLKPFGFHDYIHLQQQSLCALSDSGTISEESAILGFPAITLRNAIERPEAMDSGHIIVTGLDQRVILDSVRLAVATQELTRQHPIPAEYAISNTSHRVVKLILGTAKLSHRWDGIVVPT
ncbi:MAG: UDP-N-acetylglucosamine 2-epimerase (non-hydrolyzing) [Planctomycetaceae bacterium]